MRFDKTPHPKSEDLEYGVSGADVASNALVGLWARSLGSTGYHNAALLCEFEVGVKRPTLARL